MKQTVIIGYGNPLRGDDGIGWQVAERLAGKLDEHDTTVMMLHQLTPEIAEAVSRAHRVIFIDASIEDAPGEVSINAILPASPDTLESHSLSPQGILALANTLYDAHPEAVLITVGADSLDHSDQLSPKVEAAITDVIDLIKVMVVGVVLMPEAKVERPS
ncbi:MAG TPA: hydrogenase maturation protease [Candidatus Aquicultor sp.]|jgi:hydrogenase maturation protease